MESSQYLYISLSPDAGNPRTNPGADATIDVSYDVGGSRIK